MAIDMRVKNFFFDRPRVIHAVDRAKRKVMSKAGAFVRQGARTSIRKRKKISQPGNPPSSHEGSLRRLIFFAFDPVSEAVVIGPVKFKTSEAPTLLERGGRVTRARVVRGQKKSRVAVYRPRPFMGPALEKEAPKFPSLWARSVREG